MTEFSCPTNENIGENLYQSLITRVSLLETKHYNTCCYYRHQILYWYVDTRGPIICQTMECIPGDVKGIIHGAGIDVRYVTRDSLITPDNAPMGSRASIPRRNKIFIISVISERYLSRNTQYSAFTKDRLAHISLPGLHNSQKYAIKWVFFFRIC